MKEISLNNISDIRLVPYIQKLISLGMSEYDAEIFIDGLARVAKSQFSNLPYYKIRVTEEKVHDGSKIDLGFIKSGYTEKEVKLSDLDTAKNLVMYLDEQDIYKRVFKYGTDVNTKIFIQELFNSGEVAWYNKEWTKFVLYGDRRKVLTNWEVSKDNLLYFNIELFYM